MQNKQNFTVRYADPEDASVMEAFLLDIYEAVHNRVMAAYRAEIPEIMKVHPRTLINMIAGNLVVNLVRGSIVPDSTVSMRLEAIEDTVDELKDIINFVWKAFETTLAPMDKPN